MPIILMPLLTTSRIFVLQKQGGDHRRDLLCKVRGPSLPFRKSNGKDRVRVPVCHARPEISSCRNFQQLGKWINFYYDDQEPGNPPFNSFSVQSFPHPAHLLAFTV